MQVWRSFENIEPELAIQKICNSHNASLELRIYFPVMSSVCGVASLNHSSSMDSTRPVRGIESARWDVWEVLVHALGADAMAEIQRAVLH